jgi:hypothetical protein
MPQGVVIVVRIIFSFAGFLCLVFSFLIGVMGKNTLIAGYDPARVKDERGLSRFIGFMTLLLGLFTFLYPWVFGLERTRPLVWVAYYCIPVLVIAIIMVIGSSRFEHKKSR